MIAAGEEAFSSTGCLPRSHQDNYALLITYPVQAKNIIFGEFSLYKRDIKQQKPSIKITHFKQEKKRAFKKALSSCG